MPENRRRRLHFLVPDLDGRIVLDEGRLPVVELELGPDETTVAVARRVAAERWRRDRPVLELCFGDSASGDEETTGAADIDALAVFEPGAAGDADGWTASADRSELPAELRDRTDQWRAEWRGEQAPPALRAPWARPGWYDRVAAWTGARLADLDRPPSGPVQQRRHWSISAILRTDTPAGRAWTKAVFPGFAHEPGVTAFLDRVVPGSVAPVLAADDAEGWLLLDDIGDATVAERPDADGAAIAALIGLQRTFVDRTDELVAAGFVPRPLADLPGQLADVVAEPSLRGWLGLEPARASTIVSWLTDAVDAANDLGLPDTLVHGDFHPENVVLHDGRPVLFDWSDAAVAHPLVDAMTWSTWLHEDADRGERAWEAFLQGWADVVAPARLRAARPTVVGLTAAYHTVSYAGILLATEPARRSELGDGLREYSQALDRAVT